MKHGSLTKIGGLMKKLTGVQPSSVQHSRSADTVVVTFDESVNVNTKNIRAVTGYDVQQHGRSVTFRRRR